MSNESEQHPYRESSIVFSCRNCGRSAGDSIHSTGTKQGSEQQAINEYLDEIERQPLAPPCDGSCQGFCLVHDSSAVKQGSELTVFQQLISACLSPSGLAWCKWFERLGALATPDVINATATLVIEEREVTTNGKR
jgi:hypothetical protein